MTGIFGGRSYRWGADEDREIYSDTRADRVSERLGVDRKNPAITIGSKDADLLEAVQRCIGLRRRSDRIVGVWRSLSSSCLVWADRSMNGAVESCSPARQ